MSEQITIYWLDAKDSEPPECIVTVDGKDTMYSGVSTTGATIEEATAATKKLFHAAYLVPALILEPGQIATTARILKSPAEEADRAERIAEYNGSPLGRLTPFIDLPPRPYPSQSVREALNL